MIHHRCLLLGSLLLVCGWSASSWAQQLPPAIAAAADPSPQRGVIDSFVDSQIKKLVSNDASLCSSGRATLIAQASIAGSTPGFYDQYADAVNIKIVPLAGSKDARVRLNAAIVVAKIAARANNGRLAQATELFLKDGSDGVALWGLQSAKYVIPAQLMSAPPNVKSAITLGKAANEAARNHPNAPAITEEAYRTLLLDPALFGGGAGGAAGADFLKSIDDKSLQSFLPVTSEFFAYRVKLWEDVVPPQPDKDLAGCLFFTKQKVWLAETPAQQGQALNLMLGLLKGGAKQYAAAKSPELLDIVHRTGGAFAVIANANFKDQKFREAAAGAAKINNGSSDDDINTAITKLEDAIKSLNLVTTAGGQ